MAVTPERYGVYWVNLDPVLGREIAKTRPGVIISDDSMNRLLGTVVICPLTRRLHPHWPSRVQVKVGPEPGEVAVDQIRTVDKARIGTSVGRLTDAEAEQVRHIITQMYGVLSG